MKKSGRYLLCMAIVPLAVLSCLDRGGLRVAATTAADATESPDTVIHSPAQYPEITIELERDLLYDRYTLADTFYYRETPRTILWDRIEEELRRFDSMLLRPSTWCVLNNRRNGNGVAPFARNARANEYGNVSDTYGTERRNAIPLYCSADSLLPERYALDGSLAKLLSSPDDSLVRVEPAFIGGEWLIPGQYARIIGDSTGAVPAFDHAILTDRGQQYIVTLRRAASGSHKWMIRSVNPCTTGRHRPRWLHPTPLGIFTIQEKKPEMLYRIDGTDIIAGYAPWASRFSSGGYFHGIPVDLPRTDTIEYSSSLGTIPRSHMCVRNATSHSLFIYDNFPIDKTIVIVFE